MRGVEVVHRLAQLARDHALARPAVDEDDGLRRMALRQDVAQGVGVDAAVADDGDGIVAALALENLAQQVAQDDAHGRARARQRYQRDGTGAARRDQGRQAQAVARHLQAVGRERALEQGQVGGRGQGLGRQHFAVVALARLDQPLFFSQVEDGFERHRREEEMNVFLAVAAAEMLRDVAHSAATVRAASWVPLGTMA